MGTTPSDGSVYETRSPRYDGKTDHFFNESGSHAQPHGHVVESRTSTPSATQYDYARDAAGTVYIDNGGQPTGTPPAPMN